MDTKLELEKLKKEFNKLYNDFAKLREKNLKEWIKILNSMEKDKTYIILALDTFNNKINLKTKNLVNKIAKKYDIKLLRNKNFFIIDKHILPNELFKENKNLIIVIKKINNNIFDINNQFKDYDIKIEKEF